MKDLYTAKVMVRGGRDGRAESSDGRLSVALGFPQELGGRGDAANPEQLFVAGYAACFASSIRAAAQALAVPLGAVDIEAQATLSLRDDGSYLVSRVHLAVHADALGERAPAVLAEARRLCAYSNATHGNVVTDVVLA